MEKSSTNIRPIQLISFDQDKNLVFNKEAVQIFKQFNTEQLYIVIVAGKYRTGKSYILNRVLLNQSSGFEVSPTINACTKGLWMWPELVKISDKKGKDKNCIIIDTEGLGSLEEGQNTDIKIFLMAILLSSYLIYNSVGNIDEKALQNLSLVINLAQMLHKDSNQYDAQELINSFPSFMWLVRDFSLRLQDQKGQTITSREYLELALKNQNSLSNAAQKKNVIRKKLKTFFNDRNCFTLVRPTENQKDLQNLSKLSDKKLRPEFVKLINEFKSTIYEELKPKKIRGKSVTPQGFIELCNYFVDMINSGKLPSISSHWDNICVKQSSRIIQNYSDNYYQTLLEEIYPQNQINLTFDEKMEKVNKIYLQTIQQATQKIDKSFLGKLEKQLSKERLEKSLWNIQNLILNKIGEEKFQKAKQIVNDIFAEILLQFSSNQLESFEEIFARFEEIKGKYKQDVRIYESFYENSKNVFQEFLRNLKHQWEKQQQVLNNKNGFLEKEVEQKTSQIQQQMGKFSQQVRSLEQKNYKIQLEKSQQMNQITHLKSSHEKLSQQKQLLIEQITELQFYKKEKFQQQFYNLKKKNNKEITELQECRNKLQIQLVKLQHSFKDCQIKQRKNQREMQIFKNKCSEYLKENINLSEQIQKLRKMMLKYEKEARKSTILLHNKKGSNFLESDQLNRQFIQSLNLKIDELQNIVSLKQQQKRSFVKLLADQTETNETLLKTPQQLNYQHLKKNYQNQCQNRIKIESKMKDLEKILNLCSYRCQVCKIDKDFNIDSIKIHIKQCIETKDIDFDVSYQYNGNGDIQFVIDVIVDNYQHEWTITKTIKNIQLYLRKLKSIFPQIEESQFFKDTQKDPSSYEDSWVQERRAYLSELFNQYQHEVWFHSFMLQFFVLDIHYLNQKVQVPRDIPPRKQSMKSSKISKISSELSIDLSDLTDENIDPFENINETGNLMMKTCKFNKKTFNFGPYL